MTFPVVASTNTSSTSSAGTSHTVNLPASIASGDVLLVFVALNEDGSSVQSAFTATGWTALLNGVTTLSNQNCSLGVLARTADGTEGSTVTVTTSVSGKAAHASYRITGATGTFVIGGQNYYVGTNSAGDANPNPPLCPASGGTSDDYLWVAIEANKSTSTVSSYPTNYTNNQLNPTSGGSGAAATKVTLGVASRNATASSEDPGTFTIAASQGWGTGTVGVQPTAAAAVVPYASPYPQLLVQ